MSRRKEKSENEPRIQQVVALSTRESINAQQINLLLQTAQSLVGCLRLPGVDWNAEQPRELDGGAKIALEQSLIRVCARIDDVMTNPERWTFEPISGLEKKMSEMYEQHTALLKAQTNLAEQSAKPHMRYRPNLVLHNGIWIAILGSLQDVDNSVIGIGSSPLEALANFDGFFAGKMPDSVVNWLRLVEEAHSRGEPTPPFKSPIDNEESNQSSQLDQTGNSNSDQTPGTGENSPGDRPDAGPDDKGRGHEDRPDSGTGPIGI